MPRPRTIRTSAAPYHVTARSNNKEWFYLPMLECWAVYEEILNRTADKYRTEIHAFVLMSNHFHLLISTPSQNLPETMRYFMTETSREIGRRVGRINHIFGGRYRWSVLWGPADLAYVYKYVYRNPIRASLCRKAEQYPYSTLRKQIELRCRIPITEGYDRLWQLIPKTIEHRVDWLNRPAGKDEERLISLGLRRYEFQLPDHKELKIQRNDLRNGYGVEAVDKSEK